MKDNFYIIGLGYCSAQNLLSFQNEVAYSSGVYGWSCDYYDVDGVVISTGYSYIESKNTKHDYEMVKRYDLQAEKIRYNYELTYEQRKQQVNELLSKFIKECKENFKK